MRELTTPPNVRQWLTVKIGPNQSWDPSRWLGHSGASAWDFSPKLSRLLHIPNAVDFVERLRHLVFDLEVRAEMYEARLVVEFIDGITHILIEDCQPAAPKM